MDRLSTSLSCLPACAPCLDQVVYVADPAVTFVDGGETAEAYVVGLSGGGQPQPPAGPHRTLDMRAANGTRYRCYIPEQQGEQQEGDTSGSSGGSSSGASQVG